MYEYGKEKDQRSSSAEACPDSVGKIANDGVNNRIPYGADSNKRSCYSRRDIDDGRKEKHEECSDESVRNSVPE